MGNRFVTHGRTERVLVALHPDELAELREKWLAGRRALGLPTSPKLIPPMPALVRWRMALESTLRIDSSPPQRRPPAKAPARLDHATPKSRTAGRS